MSSFELLPPELLHYIAFGVRVLDVVDVANLSKSSRMLRETFDVDDYGHMYHKSLAGLRYCAKRGWWRAFLLVLTTGRQKANLSDELSWMFNLAPPEGLFGYYHWLEAFRLLYPKVVNESNLSMWYGNGISCCLSDEALVEMVQHTDTKTCDQKIKVETLRRDRLSLMKKLLENKLVSPIELADWPHGLRMVYQCLELLVRDARFRSVAMAYIEMCPLTQARARKFAEHACPEIAEAAVVCVTEAFDRKDFITVKTLMSNDVIRQHSPKRIVRWMDAWMSVYHVS